MTDRPDVVKLSRVRALARSGAARSIRVGAGLSLAEVAGPVGVSPSTVHRWETGERSPHGEAALRWGELLTQLIGRPA